nr:MAG TPA: SOS-response transcriptional repressor [Caudoviricetes sp.]
MNLLKIRELCERKEGGVKRLAEEIGMSEQNLHRCITLNKIQAGELEKIAHILDVHIGYFFDNIPVNQSIANGNGSAASVYGNATSGVIIDKDKEIEHLKALLEERERVITEKERTIQILIQK